MFRKKLLLKLAKIFIPKTLFLRFILIITIPIILVEIFSVRIFYERHWYNITSYNASVLARQLKLIEELEILGDKKNLEILQNVFNFELKILPPLSPEIIKKKNQKREILILNSTLNEILEKKAYSTFEKNLKKIRTYIFFDDKTLKITTDSKPLLSVTTEIYILWIIAISLIMTIISLIFAKNQIKSILELANAADNFGRNSNFGKDYKPSGAAEIRKAGYAIIKMNDRIKKNMDKRAQLLATISHDLRTPLTRMILALELMEQSEDIELIKEDAQSMKHMIESYLDYARGQESEEFIEVNIDEWLSNFIKSFRSQKVIFTGKKTAKKIYCDIKELSFKRAISNIVTNAEKYAKKCYISCKKNQNFYQIIIEDDGKGIPEIEREMVFKPFYRMDKARKIDTHGSVGLGLSITREIIISHKGIVTLEDSEKYGGLKVSIIIPIS